MKTALVAGSTGLIGRQLVDMLLANDHYSSVKILTRRPLTRKHSKLDQIIVDFDNLAKEQERLKADDVFCCLGTTIKKSGSKEAFRRVDFDYPVALATQTHSLGASQYLLVSALGASSTSPIFYNKVKGEVEDTINSLDFQAVHIFRPSLLMGDRDEARPGEDAAKIFYKVFGFLIPGKYKAINSSKVASAMIHFAKLNQKGKFIHDSKSLQKF